MADDDCACGLKYRTGGLVVAAVQMILGLSLTIAGFVTIDYYCDISDDYYECINENWISWCVAIGGCFCLTAASVLYYGIRATRPNGLMVYVAMAACSTINYLMAAVVAICYGFEAIYVILLFVTSFWFLYTVVFIFRYRKIMISQLPATRIILATPYVVNPAVPAQIVVNSGIQPGVYPAPYNQAPLGTYPGNLNPASPYPASPYPGVYNQPPPPNAAH